MFGKVFLSAETSNSVKDFVDEQLINRITFSKFSSPRLQNMLWPTAMYDNPIQNHPSLKTVIVCSAANDSYLDYPINNFSNSR